MRPKLLLTIPLLMVAILLASCGDDGGERVDSVMENGSAWRTTISPSGKTYECFIIDWNGTAVACFEVTP